MSSIIEYIKAKANSINALKNFTLSLRNLNTLLHKEVLTETDYTYIADHLKVVLSGIIQQGDWVAYLANIFQNKHSELYNKAPRLKPLLILLRDIICFYFTETELNEIVNNTYADSANNIKQETKYKVIKLFEIIATAIQFINGHVMKFAVDVCVELQIKPQDNISKILDEISECEDNAPFNYFRIGLNIIEEISSDVETMCRFITLILIIYFIYLMPDYAAALPCSNNTVDIFCSINHPRINTLFIERFPSVKRINKSLESIGDAADQNGGATRKRKTRKPKTGKRKTRRPKTGKRRVVTGGQKKDANILEKITKKISNVAKSFSEKINKTHQTATSGMIIFAGTVACMSQIIELYTNYAKNSSTESIRLINKIVSSLPLKQVLRDDSRGIITVFVNKINSFRMGNSRFNEIVNLVVTVIHPFFSGEFNHDVTSYKEVDENARKHADRVKSFYELIISILNYLTIVKKLPEKTEYSKCVTKHFDLSKTDIQSNLKDCYAKKNNETIKTLQKTIQILNHIVQSFQDENKDISSFVLFILFNLPIINMDTDEDTSSMSGQSD
jgi:hypothetical protein